LARLTPLRTQPEAIETTERFMSQVGVHSIEGLQRLDLKTLLSTRRHVMQTTPPWQTPWGTLVDGEIILEQPLVAAAAGRLAPVPLLIGACHDDYQPYPHILPPDIGPRDEGALMQHVDRLGLDGASLIQAYREWLGPVEPVSLFVAAMSDLTFCQPAIHVAERHAAHHPVYAYDFQWASPVRNGAMGAGHTVDIPFAMHTLWTPHTPYHLGDDPPLSLAEQMHAAWSAFARTGKPTAAGLPDWPPYDATQRLTMALDVTSSIQRDPQAERRRYWAERHYSPLAPSVGPGRLPRASL
jgi:para-nitrobenzyl esterase